MVMLLVYCRWYDVALLDSERPGCRVQDVLWHFLLTLALWPWPLPFTESNMHKLQLRDGAVVVALQADLDGGPVLQGSVGRRLATSFVVPLPCGTVWNMTQAFMVMRLTENYVV